MKKLNIGLIGYGFMGRAHSNAFRTAPNFFDLPYEPVLHTISARNAEKAAGFAKQWGYRNVETDWRKVVASPEIDLIDIASPNDTHAEIAIAAAKAGKMVMCEKPLGRNAAEAEGMVDAVEKAGVANMVWYNYRRVPAVTLAKQLIDEGRLGRILIPRVAQRDVAGPCRQRPRFRTAHRSRDHALPHRDGQRRWRAVRWRRPFPFLAPHRYRLVR